MSRDDVLGMAQEERDTKPWWKFWQGAAPGVTRARSDQGHISLVVEVLPG